MIRRKSKYFTGSSRLTGHMLGNLNRPPGPTEFAGLYSALEIDHHHGIRHTVTQRLSRLAASLRIGLSGSRAGPTVIGSFPGGLGRLLVPGRLSNRRLGSFLTAGPGGGGGPGHWGKLLRATLPRVVYAANLKNAPASGLGQSPGRARVGPSRVRGQSLHCTSG
jgi:hypothetical protein